MSALKSFVGKRKTTPQTEVIPGRENDMTRNASGGMSFRVDPMTQLERFLILGSESGSYRVGAAQLTAQNAQNIVRLFSAFETGFPAVKKIVEISQAGRAPSNDPALFALALAASSPVALVRQHALAVLPKVARIGTHLFTFVGFVDELRGWGNGLKRGVANWYESKTSDQFAFQVAKYPSRNGWSHKDVLKLAHPHFVEGSVHYDIGDYLLHGLGDDENPRAFVNDPPRFIEGVEVAKVVVAAEKDPKIVAIAVAKLIEDYGLTREMVPTECLNYPEVWEALLYTGKGMPLEALVRNLNKLTAVGLLTDLGTHTKYVVERLNDGAAIKAARLHPLKAFVAQRTYAKGAGIKGSLTWKPVQAIVNALEETFQLGFDAVEPTRKNFLLGLDVSGSMSVPILGGVMTAREATGLLALVTARTEQNFAAFGFTSNSQGYGGQWGQGEAGFTPIALSKRDSLDSVLKKVDALKMGGTDCGLPIRHAIKHKLDVDAFIVYTDSETWAGPEQPSQSLAKYNNAFGKQAKLIVVGMTATDVSIADPTSPNMLDVVGFDTSVPSVIADFVTGGKSVTSGDEDTSD